MMIIKYIGTFIALLTVVIIIGLLTKKDKPSTPSYNNKLIKYVNAEGSSIEDTKDQYRIGITYSGDKKEIIDLMEGHASFDLIYNGKNHFTANILKPDGKIVAILADKQGSFKKTRFTEIKETGTYILDVKTKGEWSYACK